MKQGIPSDVDKATEYMNTQERTANQLTQWLEDFKSKFGEYPESHKTIGEVESALKTYKEVVGKVKVPLDIKRARSARKEDGSILEYGLEWTVNRLVDAVGVPLFMYSLIA